VESKKMADLPSALTFFVIKSKEKVPSSAEKWSAYLNSDLWDDWGKFCTQFYLTIVDGERKQHGIGQLKIGQRGLKAHSGKPPIPKMHRKPAVGTSFKKLGDAFFSVGQDEDYYANLSKLEEKVRELVLTALGDVAWDHARWDWAKDEYVMGESLLRSVTRQTVEGQFRRMARGDARVTPFDFSYQPPKRLGDGEPPFRLTFSVDPGSPIPTNVHVLIGRNGVGKTRLLSLMTKALVARDATAKQSGKFAFEDEGKNDFLVEESTRFANVVSVSFSAFDDGDLLPDRPPESDTMGYAHIGLRGWTSGSPTAPVKPKSPAVLAAEFVESLRECRIGARRRRWLTVLGALQSDPVFRAAQVEDLIEADLASKEDREGVLKTFKKLSSGHKIVLLTLTKLVEKVEERTLVLIDEPEAHLHPPLLSAMTRALSGLLVARNGVAIVATHSPIILQEVPRSCVWILDREVSVSKAERPSIETFAEAIGILSREVFKLELTQSGYHRLLKEVRQSSEQYQGSLHRLEGQLGSEGKAILRAMFMSDEG